MDGQIKRESGNGFLRELFFVIRRNLILILLIVLIFTAGGLGYSFMVEPSYTASVRVNFQAEVASNSGVTTNINAMRAYIDTIVDFCDERVVLDRANYYFEKWIDVKASGETTLTEYVNDLKAVDNYSADFDTPDKNYSASNVKVTTYGENDTTNFIFSIAYTDKTVDLAKEKVELLVHAFTKEVVEKEGESGKYFGELNVIIQNLGHEGSVANVSKMKITVIAFLLGALVAAGVVYIKNLVDNTVTSKEELENITGVPVIANIANVGGEENGK